MKESENYKNVLKREGLKNTRHRNSVLEVVERSDQPLTAEEIYILLREENISINISSVYRILDTLVLKGLLAKSKIEGDSRALYEMNFMEHKHHLICSGCRKMVPIDGCPLSDYEKLITDKTGFDVTGHKLEIYGICRACKMHGQDS
jgi:Fur family ferric uptake transcriptional regulator